MSVKAENGFRCTSASNTTPSLKGDYVFIALAFYSNNTPSTVSIAVHNATVITQRRIQMAYVPMFAGLYQDTANGITVNLTPSPYQDASVIYDWGMYYCIMG